MKLPKVEPHHIVFAIVAIFVTVVAGKFIESFEWFENGVINFIVVYIILLFVVRLLIFVIYSRIFLSFFKGYKSESPLGVDDLNLTTAAIVTTYMAFNVSYIVFIAILAIVGLLVSYYLIRKIPFTS